MLGIGSSDGRIVLVEVEEGDRETDEAGGGDADEPPGCWSQSSDDVADQVLRGVGEQFDLVHSRVRAPGDGLTRGR
jgi:hypothetical protein